MADTESLKYVLMIIYSERNCKKRYLAFASMLDRRTIREVKSRSSFSSSYARADSVGRNINCELVFVRVSSENLQQRTCCVTRISR